jgi:hypothetical protein
VIREIPTQHPFGRGRAFRDDERQLQALVSDEVDARGRRYQHVSVSGRGKLPTHRAAARFVDALRAKGYVDHEPRAEHPSQINPHVRHFVPSRLLRS